MESAVLNQVGVVIQSADKQTWLRASGSVVVFDGFLTLYQEGQDDKGEDENGDKILPDVAVGDTLNLGPVKADQHFTQPPPRYTEASLVKRMEELGIFPGQSDKDGAQGNLQPPADGAQARPDGRACNWWAKQESNL